MIMFGPNLWHHPVYYFSPDKFSPPSDQCGSTAGTIFMGPTGQCFTGLDEARPAGAGLNLSNLWLNSHFRRFIIIVVKLDLRFSSPQGQSTQLVESNGGDERDQAGAEAAFHLHPQPVVSSRTVTAATEGPLQQPAGKLQQSFDYPFKNSWANMSLCILMVHVHLWFPPSMDWSI